MAGPFVIYSRKSRFTGKGESVENQIEMCRQYIALHYGAAEAESARVYEDEGFSGGTLERPQFRRMMRDAQHAPFAAIVVYRLDRISRNIGDFAGLIEQLGRMRIGFVSIKEQFDTSSPMGRAMMYISSVFSQLERETIAERIRDNMHELAKTGRWLGGMTPLGYASESVARVTVDGKAKKACRLREIPEELHLVKRIFDTFLETGSLTQTDAFLLEKRYVTRRGNRFSRFAIRAILTNPVYMLADADALRYWTDSPAGLCAVPRDFDAQRGMLAYNRTLQQPGKAHQLRPMDEWIVAVGQHQGVIPGAQWVRAQALLERNRSKAYRRPRSHTALLSGLLRCGGCGGYMRPKARAAAGDAPRYAYLCAVKERSRGQCCAMANAEGHTLDRLLLETLGRLPYDGAALARRLGTSRPVPGGADAERARLEAQLAAGQAAADNLVAALARSPGEAAQAAILRQLDALHESCEALRGQLAACDAAARRDALPQEEFERLSRALSTPQGALERAGVETQRSALRALVERVVWDGETAHVYLLGSSAEGGPLGADSK